MVVATAADISRVISGVRLVPLVLHSDRRGWLYEAFREGWVESVDKMQVNVSWSRPGTLRGCHVHGRHCDWFVMASGKALVGMKDVRRHSPTCGNTAFVEINASSPEALVVTPGVIHGVYFPTDAILVTIETALYDPAEEFRCRWNDPELGIGWPFSDPCLSDLDREAQSLDEMMRQFAPWQDRLKVI
ncbi:MAG TPA: dTDP-4-dehydrorhamnose 3,5-epimerase family protein [Nevskiaceae bacterium]|nr:dTDP-4-dehydrorhamnose 3,5-epimerase family protein [Nevskiaceae bacterium]